MGVLCRKWHKTALQEDKVVLGRGKSGSLSLESNLVWARESFWFMKNTGVDGHLLLCTLLFPACLRKKLVEMSAVLDSGSTKRCGWVALFVYNSSLACWIWGWENRSKEQEFPAGCCWHPPELRKAGDVLGTSCPERFSHRKGPDGVSSGCSQLITCFCFHLCSPVGLRVTAF